MLNTIDQREFRDSCGKFLTGVTVVTTNDTNGESIGVTANSFTSVSLDPPLILVCLDKKLYSINSFLKAENFGLHILSEEQQKISSTFATKGADKFLDVETEKGINEIPLLKNYLVRMQCEVFNKVDAGDHVILIGEVKILDKSNEDKKPLGFFSGKYVNL